MISSRSVFGWLSLLGLGFCCVACAPDPEVCDDGLDNDNNGLVDCADQAVCGEDPVCIEGGNCQDGIDNDLDGLLDCESPACEDDPDCDRAIDLACSGLNLAQRNEETLGNNGAGSDVLAGSCTGGNGAPEFVFIAGSGVDTTFTITLLPDPQNAADLGLYVRESCLNADSEVGCSDELGAGGAEVIRNLPVRAGNVVTIVVDGSTAEDVGAFTLLIEEP